MACVRSSIQSINIAFCRHSNRLFLHNQRKYIVETKIWEGDRSYQAGKQQLAVYLKLEGVTEGYYVVFDHRQNPQPRLETQTVEGVRIRSYVIPVIQAAPSNVP